MSDKAKIIVTLVCEYDGENVDDYNNAMNDAWSNVQTAGDDLAEAYEHVRVIDTEATG